MVQYHCSSSPFRPMSLLLFPLPVPPLMAPLLNEVDFFLFSILSSFATATSGPFDSRCSIAYPKILPVCTQRRHGFQYLWCHTYSSQIPLSRSFPARRSVFLFLSVGGSMPLRYPYSTRWSCPARILPLSVGSLLSLARQLWCPLRNVGCLLFFRSLLSQPICFGEVLIHGSEIANCGDSVGSVIAC